METLFSAKTVIRFSKVANLEKFYKTGKGKSMCAKYLVSAEDAQAMRTVSLYVIVHGANDDGPIVSIRCPINPLPVRGKFTAHSVSGLIRWLEKDGWKKMECIEAN